MFGLFSHQKGQVAVCLVSKTNLKVTVNWNHLAARLKCDLQCHCSMKVGVYQPLVSRGPGEVAKGEEGNA